MYHMSADQFYPDLPASSIIATKIGNYFMVFGFDKDQRLVSSRICLNILKQFLLEL